MHANDIFNMFFGGGGAGRSSGNSSDPFSNLFRERSAPTAVQLSLSLTFLESVLGTKRQLAFSRKSPCASCHGTGVQPGKSLQTCSGCQGRGTMSFRRGGMVVESLCIECGGQGKKNPHACGSCRGTGLTLEKHDLEVEVPPGVENEQVLVVPGVGHATSGHGKARGHLELLVNVHPHPFFKRQQLNILSDVNISFLDALLGTDVSLPTIHGNVQLIVKPGTQPGDTYRLRGKGIQSGTGKSQGDHLASIKVTIPKQLSKKEKEILETLKKEMKGHSFSTKDHSFNENTTQTDSKEASFDHEQKEYMGTREQQGQAGIKDWLKSKMGC